MNFTRPRAILTVVGATGTLVEIKLPGYQWLFARQAIGNDLQVLGKSTVREGLKDGSAIAYRIVDALVSLERAEKVDLGAEMLTAGVADLSPHTLVFRRAQLIQEQHRGEGERAIPQLDPGDPIHVHHGFDEVAR